MTKPKIQMTTTSRNANGWTQTNFSVRGSTLVYPSVESKFDLTNNSLELAIYRLYDPDTTVWGAWVRLYGITPDRTEGDTDELDTKDGLKIEMRGSEGGPTFATLTLTKGPGGGDG